MSTNADMSIASNHSSASRFAEVTQLHDPFVVLSDLEITLILDFLSVKETIAIRRVSTLWKACVDFRLSKAAIGRHFPGTAEANARYSNWEEASIAFRKLAFVRGTQAKPNIARKFDIGTSEVWCICNHHMVWVDEININIQRIWDSKNPTRDSFPVTRKSLRAIQFQDKPRGFMYPEAKWIAGEDKNGIVVIYLGVPFNEKPTHPKWLLAISVTGRILWQEKHMHKIRRTIFPSPSPKTNSSSVSFGDGVLCFVDTGSHPPDHSRCVTQCVAHTIEHNDLVVIDIFCGAQKIRKLMPSKDHSILPQGFDFSPCGEIFAAHPTKEVCFLFKDREMSVFWTRTGDLIESYTVPLGSPGAGHGLRWEFCYFHFGSGGQTWLLFEATNLIVGYEIELEKFQITRQRTWNLVHNVDYVELHSQVQRHFGWGIVWSTRLDPVSGLLYVVDREALDGEQPSRITAVEFEPTEGTSDYHIRTVEFLTLPPKKKTPTEGTGVKRVRSRKESKDTDAVNEIELPNGRREFAIPSEISWRLFWRTGPYIMLKSDGYVWVFGFVPRW